MLHPAFRTAVVLLALLPSAAWAGERQMISVPSVPLEEAIFILARQTGCNIGLRDPQLNKLRVRAVRGKLTAQEALAVMLRDLPVRAERAGHNSWIIKVGAVPQVPPPTRARRSPSPRPAEPSRQTDEEIVVTASKRETRLDDLPATVTIIAGDALAPLPDGANGIALTARSVSLSSTHFGAGRNKLFIRGIADSAFAGPTQATVGQYLGEYRIAYSSPDPDLRLHDLERIEILEGPQGTLYGAGSMGGLVRYVPLAPDPGETSGRVSVSMAATQSGKPGGEMLAAVNLPMIVGRVALRGNAYIAEEGGYIDAINRDRGDVNRNRTSGGRLTAHAILTDDVSVEASIAAQSIASRDSPYANQPGRRLSRVDYLAQPYTSRFALAGMTVKSQLGSFDATASFSHSAHRTTETFDATLTNTPLTYFDQARRSNLESGEIRFGRSTSDGSSVVFGLSFLSNRNRTSQSVTQAGVSQFAAAVDNHYREWTAFGEKTVIIRPWLQATVGGRLSAVRSIGVREGDAPIVAPTDMRIAARRSQVTAAPSASLLLRPSAGVTSYLRYEEGYRPGAIAIDSSSSYFFNSDRIHTTELGMRLGRQGVDPWSAEMTVSRSLWTNIQADVAQGIGLPLTINIGDGTIETVQAKLAYAPTTSFAIDGAILVNKSRLTEPSLLLRDSDAFSTFFGSGRANLPNVARLSARLGVRFNGEIPGGWVWDLDAMARYTGRSRLGIGLRYDKLQGSFVQSNIIMRLRRDNIGAFLSLSNLTNDSNSRFGIGNPFAEDILNQFVPQRPRTLVLGFDISF